MVATSNSVSGFVYVLFYGLYNILKLFIGRLLSAHGMFLAHGRFDGRATHQIKVRVDDVNAHFEHAKARGATILMEPTDWEYGQREYTVADPWGHQWEFTETLADVDPADWGGDLLA